MGNLYEERWFIEHTDHSKCSKVNLETNLTHGSKLVVLKPQVRSVARVVHRLPFDHLQLECEVESFFVIAFKLIII